MIGWKHIFCGRFVSEWRTLQDAHLQTVPEKEKHHKGSTWVTGITQILWEHMRKNWNSRNEARHGQKLKFSTATKITTAQSIAIHFTPHSMNTLPTKLPPLLQLHLRKLTLHRTHRIHSNATPVNN